MRSNHWESWLGITSFGESHGKAIGVVLEDIKPGIKFPLQQIQQELNERKPGKGKYSTLRNEADRLEVISGVLNGLTTGMPICLMVYNTDQRSTDYEAIKNIFRPGHADYSFFQKFKIYDYRGGGRASGRETISRIAASGLTEDLLTGIKIDVYPCQIATITATAFDPEFKNELSWRDRTTYTGIIQLLDKAKESGNSIGGIVECRISNVPAGLGDPVFEKLDANLAKALISIGSVKGIEFGSGFELSRLTGSEANDQMRDSGFLSNKAGGILGGISTGQDIVFRFAVKPTPSVKLPQSTVDINNETQILELNGRFDTCIIPRILPVARAMVKLVLADAVSYQNLVSNNSLDLSLLREGIDKIDEDILIALRRRSSLAQKIGEYKKQNQLPVKDEEREIQLLNDLRLKAEKLQLDPEIILNIWKLMINEARKMQ